MKLLAGIPDFYSSVYARARQITTIGAEGYAKGRASVASQRMEQLTSFGIPDFDRGVIAGRGDPFTIRAVGDATYKDTRFESTSSNLPVTVSQT